MLGIDSKTGSALSGILHLRQSIADILTTPIGSRVMRRAYGSRLFELVDAPLNDATIVDIYAATAEALIRWEPRFKLLRVRFYASSTGVALIDVDGIYRPDGKAVTLDGIELR